MKRFQWLFVAVLLVLTVFAQAEVRPPVVLSSISLTSPNVIGGNTVEGRVTLAAPMSEDVEVTLAVDPPRAATVPSSVTVKSGETSATFTVTTLASKTAIGGLDNVIGIYANYGVTKRVILTVLAPVSFDSMVDRVIVREIAFMENLKTLHPLTETYIQDMRENGDHVVTPIQDHYFLGRLDMSKKTEEDMFKEQKSKGGFFSPFTNLRGTFKKGERAFMYQHYVPQGFAHMVLIDRNFNKDGYYFNFVRQEFLGEVRCIVVDVQPREHAPRGSFMGRIWVEDKEFNIVRFNGTYSEGKKGLALTHFADSYLHFDSWRVNAQPGIWLPSYVYSEETSAGMVPFNSGKMGPMKLNHFKAQTRLWDYDEVHIKHASEMTDVRVDDTEDRSDAVRPQAVPLEGQREWEKMAEDNTLDHLQKSGLLAPPGPVDKMLQTVVNNLIVTNNLDIIPEVRCRVLLTTPIESLIIGHTIVISRGLLDVLPDEASLAMIISHELAHIALGHKINTRLAFTDRFFFPDPQTFQRMDFQRSPLDEAAADTKAIELLNNSPYKDKLASGGLFLKQVQERAGVLSNLIRPHLGNPLDAKGTTRLAPVAAAAPQLEKRVDQIAALSLGARINVNPWSNTVEMMSPKHVTILSTGEKMPLEVTPFFPYLTRTGPASTTDGMSEADKILVEARRLRRLPAVEVTSVEVKK